MAFDGQYIKMGVNKELCRQLNIEKEVPNTWDPMHLLEKSQEDSETTFISSTCEIINAVMKDLKWGKSLELLLTFKDLVDVFYKPKIFKDMKMVSHADNVFITFASDYKAIVATLKSQTDDILGKILEPGFIFNLIFLRDIISKLSGLSKVFQISNQLPFEYPRKYRAFICELDQAVLQTKAFENLITVILSMQTEHSFQSINTKEKFVKRFPDMKYLPDANFPDFSKFSNDKDSFVQHLVVYAALVLDKTAYFHDQLQKLIIQKVFMGCPLIATLERTSRFKVKWSSSSNMLLAMEKSLNGHLKYLEGLRSNVSNRLMNSFKVQDLYGNIISYRYLMFPQNDVETIVPNKEKFIGELKQFQFFPNDNEDRNILFTQYQELNSNMIKLCRESRSHGNVVNEICLLKKVYHTAGHEMQRLLDALVSIPTSEAICETWGSVIDKVSGDKPRSNDGSSSEMVYGTVENRMMVMLNGPPPGYKNNEKLLKHSLERLYGLNYRQNFTVKTSKFKTMSKVLDNIKEGKHDPSRNIASSRLLSYFK